MTNRSGKWAYNVAGPGLVTKKTPFYISDNNKSIAGMYMNTGDDPNVSPECLALCTMDVTVDKESLEKSLTTLGNSEKINGTIAWKDEKGIHTLTSNKGDSGSLLVSVNGNKRTIMRLNSGDPGVIENIHNDPATQHYIVVVDQELYENKPFNIKHLETALEICNRDDLSPQQKAKFITIHDEASVAIFPVTNKPTGAFVVTANPIDNQSAFAMGRFMDELGKNLAAKNPGFKFNHIKPEVSMLKKLTKAIKNITTHFKPKKLEGLPMESPPEPTKKNKFEKFNIFKKISKLTSSLKKEDKNHTKKTTLKK